MDLAAWEPDVVTVYFGIGNGTFCTSGVLIGDVNLDGIIDLLDVSPFVGLIATMGFQLARGRY